MIKKIILFSLIATTGVIGIRRMNQPTEATTVDLTVDNYQVGQNDVQTPLSTEVISDVLIGTQQNVTVLPGQNFAAMFVNNYYRDNGEVGSNNKVVVKSTETTVENYYASPDAKLVFVVDTNNYLIAHTGVAIGSTLGYEDITMALDEMSTPPGYQMDTNLYYGDDMLFMPGVTPITDTMILRSKLTYDPSYRTYQVAVNGDTASVMTQEGTAATVADVLFDRQAKVTSTSEYFRYWMVGDKIVSYESTYAFSVYSDVIIKEVVGTELDDPVVPEPVINLYHDEANDDMSSLFVCGYELPAGYTAVESGMLFGGETYETAVEKIPAESISTNHEFAVRYYEDQMSVQTAYLIYKDTLDQIDVIYDNGYGYEQMYLGNAVGSIQGINDAITSSYGTIDAEGGDVYGETGVDGIKMGSSTNPGVLCFTLPDGKLTDKVVVNAKAYNSIDENIMVINDTNEVDTLTDNFEYYTIDLDAPSNEVNFDTGMGETRFYINSVEIYYEDRNVEAVERNSYTALNAIQIGEDDTVIDTSTLPTQSMGFFISWTLDGAPVTELNTTNLIDQELDNNLDFVATIDGTAYSRTINISSVATDTTKANIISWVDSQPGFFDPENVVDDLVLPSEYSAYDTTIAITNWTSDDPAIVIDGNTGMITRGETDSEIITLTYDFTIAGISYTGDSYVIVKAAEVPAFLTYDFTTVGGSSNKINTNEEMKTILDGINATVNAAELTSITDVNTYIYSGINTNAKISCLKFSSSSVDGVFTMNFSATTTITRVVVTGCGWTSGTNALAVGGVTNTFTNATEWDAEGNTANYNIQQYEYDIADSSSITFQADNRVLVTSIDLYTD